MDDGMRTTAGRRDVREGILAGPATYRRRIEVVPGEGRVDAAMEDFVHHFEVTLGHDGERVTAASAEGVRVPWATCPSDAAGVAAMVGTSLVDAPLAQHWVADRRDQCVHTVDLAALAAAHALDDAPLVYEVRIDLATFTDRRARLWRDGELLLDWQVEAEQVVGAGHFAGMGLDRASLSAWLHERVDPADREPVVVLRRACSISRGRLMDLDVLDVAADARFDAPDSCSTYRVGVAERSVRVRGTARHTELDPFGTPIPAGPVAARTGG